MQFPLSKFAISIFIPVVCLAPYAFAEWQDSVASPVVISVREKFGEQPAGVVVFTVTLGTGNWTAKSAISGDEQATVTFPNDFVGKGPKNDGALYKWSASIRGEQVGAGQFVWRNDPDPRNVR